VVVIKFQQDHLNLILGYFRPELLQVYYILKFELIKSCQRDGFITAYYPFGNLEGELFFYIKLDNDTGVYVTHLDSILSAFQ
jgi:hypothetical protein